MSDSDPQEMPGSHRVARQLGKSARKLARGARDASRTARPQVEQVARETSDRAQPFVSRAVQFLRDHDAELRQAGATGARVVASRTGPPMLRPVITAMTDELTRRPPVPMRDPNLRKFNAVPTPPPRKDADDGANPEPRPRNFF